MKLVFATHNPGKLQEVRELLAPHYEVIGLTDLGDHEEIEETAQSLEGNAWIKARTVWQKHGLSCFSDDTGLEIEALSGAPGAHDSPVLRKTLKQTWTKSFTNLKTKRIEMHGLEPQWHSY